MEILVQFWLLLIWKSDTTHHITYISHSCKRKAKSFSLYTLSYIQRKRLAKVCTEVRPTEVTSVSWGTDGT